MSSVLHSTRRWELSQKGKRRLPPAAAKAKAWSPKVSDLRSQSYTFKGRVGRSVFFNNTSRLSSQRFSFRLRARESGTLSTQQIDVLWRTLRRKIRRFSVNFRRSALTLRLYPVATKTQTKRPKGGRMGSGKSAVSGRVGVVLAGQVLFECNELRNFPYNSFLELRSAAKKMPIRCQIEVVKFTF